MKNTTTVLLFGLFVLAGCTTTGGHLFVKTSIACPPLSDTVMFVLLPKRPKGPIDGIKIGRAFYAERLHYSIPTSWTRDLFVDSLRSLALQHGANLAKVTGFMWATMRDGEYFDVDLYRVPDIQRYKNDDELDWSTRHQLRFDDFKFPGPILDDPSIGQSRGTYELTTVAKFHCQTSWINRASKDSAELLLHEQGLFDLCEIYCRQYRYAILRQNDWWPTEFDKINKAWMAKRSQYEWQTFHGLDSARQAEWTAKINHALLYGTGGSDADFKVN
ncbi:hypothetical protein [Puia dinghuensis]|nr:hypothetical protein [Puia dinghuensis]